MPRQGPQLTCDDGPDGCRGEVHWQLDGRTRCAFHAARLRRRRIARGAATWIAVLLIVVAGGVGVNALIDHPREGPSQAKAWEVCHDAVADLVPVEALLPPPPNPGDISDSVKIQIPLNIYVVRLLVDVPDPDGTVSTRDYRCTISYLEPDGWRISRIDLVP